MRGNRLVEHRNPNSSVFAFSESVSKSVLRLPKNFTRRADRGSRAITMSGVAATQAAQAAAPYWRTAGMTYLSYANTCAAMVRNCLKEPFKTKALQREHAYYKVQPFENGAPQKAVVRESGAPPSS